MRILHVIQEMRTGGAERVVVSLASGAAASGHAVAVASASGQLADEVPGARFPLPLVERRPWRVPGAALRLRRTLRAWRPDLVHCHNPGMALVTSTATVRGRRPRAIVSVHGVPEEAWPVTARLLRLTGLPAVACGPGVAAALDERGFRVLATIPNGIAPPPPAASRAALEHEWGLPPGGPFVVAVGRLVAAKNHMLAVQALARLPGAALAIIGEGPLERELEGEAHRQGVRDRLVLAGERRDARAIMAAADAVVVSSRTEGLPLVVLEALASGTPLVATAVRGIRELLADGDEALLVPPGDPALLAAALGRVLADPALSKRLSAGGRALAARYGEAAMVERFLDLYMRVGAR